MGSPAIGQPQPPAGYQMEVKPPAGYTLESKPVQIALPELVLQQVLDKNPGLGKNFNSQNTKIVFADKDRSSRGLRDRGSLEFWSPTDSGTKDFPHPLPGKNVLEIYSNDLKQNPEALSQAVYGDLMHGMSADPYWSGLRQKFMSNFTPEELQRQKDRQTWWNDVNGTDSKQFGPTYDAYIRGWIANEGEGKQGQIESKNTMYSPAQLQILQKMQDYLSTGKNPQQNTQRVKPALPQQ